MTLDEAVRHCCSKASSDTECGREHAQLAEWLAELKELREENAKLQDGYGSMSREHSELVVEHSDALYEVDRLKAENEKLRAENKNLIANYEMLSVSYMDSKRVGEHFFTELKRYKSLLRAKLPERELMLIDEIKKLREMCRDLYILRFEHQVDWKLVMETYENYGPCDLCHREHGGKSPCASTAKDMSEECCNPYQAAIVAEKLRELGIEVPE